MRYASAMHRLDANALADAVVARFRPRAHVVADLRSRAPASGSEGAVARELAALVSDALLRGGEVWVRTFDEGARVVLEVSNGPARGGARVVLDAAA